MSFGETTEGARNARTRSDGGDAKERVSALMIAERYFTVEEYTQLCADMTNGKVEIRRFDDGVVLVRNY